MCHDQTAEIAGTFRDCHADLVAFFARQHPDPDAAADLASESVLQLLRKLAAGTRPGSMRAYLFGIAKHVGMAARRQRAGRPAVVDATTLAAVTAPDRDPHDPVAAARDLLAGLRLMQPDGTLSEPIFDDAVEGVSWLPDGSGLVVARTIEVATWAEAKAMLPKEEVEAIEALAKIVPAVIRAVADSKVKSMDDFSSTFCAEELLSLSLKTVTVAGLCVRDRHGEELRAALRALPPTFFDQPSNAEPEERPLSDEEKFAERWRLVQSGTMPVHELALVPIADGQVSGKIRSLFGSVRELSRPAVAPRGDWVAVRHEGSLIVLGLEGEQRILMADNVCSDPVWLADGVSLAYVTAPSGDAGPAAFKTLQRKTLVADGPDTMKAGDGTAVMAGLFPTGAYGTRLAALPGDRLLIPAVEMTLPLRPDAESPPRARLFIIDAAVDSKAPPVAVNTAADALPQDVAAFAVSPDGTRAAVVEAGSDAVAVVDLATGRVDPITAATGPKTGCGTLPAWRNDRELLIQTCRPNGEPRQTWAIWQEAAPLRWLDETWTDADKERLPRCHVEGKPKKE